MKVIDRYLSKKKKEYNKATEDDKDNGSFPLKEIDFINPFSIKLSQHYSYNNKTRCYQNIKRRATSWTISKNGINNLERRIKNKYFSVINEESICVWCSIVSEMRALEESLESWEVIRNLPHPSSKSFTDI